MEFVDLKAQYNAYRKEIDAAVAEVLSSCRFIGGEEIAALEGELARYTGVKHAVACGNGTDALLLPLLALDVKPGDEIIVPDFTFFATAEMVALIGAVPVFVDVDPVTCNLDPSRITAKITSRTRGLIPVSLYGQCADMDAINAVAARHGLWVMEDAAQSFGATYRGRKSCGLSRVAATSFFPAKPLGCYGDGGAMFTDDDELAGKLRMLRNHGQSKRYSHALVGVNSRLDTIQAAVLRVKLRHLDVEIAARNKVAAAYTKLLEGVVQTPSVLAHNLCVWAQYTIRSRGRDQVRKKMEERGVPTAVHYPSPLHAQPAFSGMPPTVDCPESQRAAAEVLSLPMHPFLKESEIESVCRAVRDAVSSL